MASGKSFVSVLIAVKFLTEICFSVAFPVEGYADINDTKPEVKFFECHAMACLIGYQFCHPFWKRCDDCLLYDKDCFTSRQQPNCTVFCQETWLTKQREILKTEKCKTGEGQNFALPWIVATAVLAVLLLACGCVLLLIKIRFSVRWISLKLPNRSEINRGAVNQINIDKTAASTFLVKDDSLKQEQVICTNRNLIKGQHTIVQSSHADRCLDPKSIYSDRSNIMNTSPPRPETDSDD
ncbi:hypothetical protein CHS0354_028339 [Potamilus streckersoni]|uniref:Uncharacterized protein n=1 Tax=Potamilus streckersoni TaxID=2493646 RepID=A0AAE0VJV3_9BIVA|nr:hypothetical protein CHS0354_028339 [Potamilus streckersoni]